MSGSSASFPRPFLLLVAVALALTAPVSRASAQSSDDASEPAAKKKTERRQAAKKKTEEATGAPGGAKLVATFGDWGAYTAQSGRAKVCYALAQPKSRSPSNLKDTKAYLFVSFRPADNVRNELASVLNFDTKDGGPATLAIGQTSYDLITRGKNAWIKTANEEAPAIAAMAKAGSLTVQATSARGNKTSDRYSLTGFSQALERARSDCP